MSSLLDNPAIRQAALSVTVEQYHRLGETGVIGENTELLQGVIVEKMVKSPLHSWLVQYLVEWLRNGLQPGAHVRQEQPLTFADSEPEPDVAVVAGEPANYRASHPSTAFLVIEVAISSAEVDRAKANLYAAAAVLEYVIVLPDERRVDVYTHPDVPGYSQQRSFRPGDVLTLTSLPPRRLEVSTLFND